MSLTYEVKLTFSDSEPVFKKLCDECRRRDKTLQVVIKNKLKKISKCLRINSKQKLLQ